MALKSGNIIQAKTGSVARTNTSSKALFTLPANGMVVGIRTFGDVPENAQTLTLESRVPGSTSVATFATVAVGTTEVYNTAATLSGISYARQSTPVYITGKWAEATTNTSTAGGPYSVVVEYL